jgi:lytic murein transglycosylase
VVRTEMMRYKSLSHASQFNLHPHSSLKLSISGKFLRLLTNASIERCALILTAIILLSIVLVSLTLHTATADERGETEHAFQVWLHGDFKRTAMQQGISDQTLTEAFSGIKLNWSIPDLRPSSAPAVTNKWQQSEFRAPARYFDQASIRTLIRIARTKLLKHGETIASIEARFGVPGGILLAIWGRESAFGAAKIPHDALRALATQAFIGRRREFFAHELLAALAMLQSGDVSRVELRSSWAGALGQPQFLPSKYLAYAIDGDGDGTRDIWNSVPDTLASIANFLNENGWQSGQDWGFESVIPPSLACSLEGPDQGRLIGDWIALGVKRVSSRVFPDAEKTRPGFLLMPAGRYGPAFIAKPNFYVLKSYNESDLYALFIGHLNDRIRANQPFASAWDNVADFKRTDIHLLQLYLENQGYDVGGADGLIGHKTRRSVGDYQSSIGVKQTCFPDLRLIESIL